MLVFRLVHVLANQNWRGVQLLVHNLVLKGTRNSVHLYMSNVG